MSLDNLANLDYPNPRDLDNLEALALPIFRWYLEAPVSLDSPEVLENQSMNPAVLEVPVRRLSRSPRSFPEALAGLADLANRHLVYQPVPLLTDSLNHWQANRP